jgi:hypothetical protein
MEELYPQYQEKLNMIFADCQEKEMNELAHMLTKVEQNAF